MTDQIQLADMRPVGQQEQPQLDAQPNAAPPTTQQPSRSNRVASTRRQLYMQTAFAFLIAMNTHGLNLAYGVYYEYYMNWEQTTMVQPILIHMIGAVQLSAMFFTVFPVSKAYESGWFGRLTVPAAFVLVAAQFVLGVIKGWTLVFLVQGVIMGTAMGVLSNVSTLVLMGYFDRDFGQVVSIGATGACVGGIVYSALVSQALAYLGWRNASYIVGSVMILTLFFTVCFACPHPEQLRNVTGRTTSRTNWTFLAHDHSLNVMAINLCAFAGLYPAYYFTVDFAVRDFGLYPIKAVSVLYVALTGNLVGRPVFQYLGMHRLGPVTTLLPCLTGLGVIYFTFLFIRTPAQLHILFALIGVLTGGIHALYPVAIDHENVSRPRCFDEVLTFREKVQLTSIGFGVLLGSICALLVDQYPVSDAARHAFTLKSHVYGTAWIGVASAITTSAISASYFLISRALTKVLAAQGRVVDRPTLS